MALNFPTSPSVGQPYTYNNRTWTYDGTTWQQSVGTAASGLMKIGQVVCVGGETTITFSNIPQNFDTIQIRIRGRDTATGSSILDCPVKINGDTTSTNYTSTHRNYNPNDNTAWGADSQGATADGGYGPSLPGTSGFATAVGDAVLWIDGYTDTAFHKIVRTDALSVHGATPIHEQLLRAFVWKSTAAVTSITIKAGGTAFAAGTTATLYGIGGNSQQSSPTVYESTTAPSNPFAGQLWWKTDEGNLKVYYNSAWVDAMALGGNDPSVCQGRLTLTTAVPVTTSDVTGATTIYFTPYKGNRIALYDGTSVWTTLPFSEVSIALGTLTSGKNYDVFAYNNGGVLALEFSAAWTSDTARADALTLQDGAYVKSANKTRRYLGTFRTTSTTTTEDSAGGASSQVGGKRFLWNMYNRKSRSIGVFDGTSSWTYSNTATWRQANGAAGNKVEFVVGLIEDSADVTLCVTLAPGASGAGNSGSGIGLNSTTSPGNFAVSSYGEQLVAQSIRRCDLPQLGYNYMAWLERATQSGTTTWYGSGATPNSGMMGRVQA